MDIRWIQRLENYQKALDQLNRAVKLSEERQLSELEEQGMIQSFEYTHELAWKTLKDFLNYKGNNEIYGSKDATKEAFKYGLISDGEIWMQMIQSRNKTSHTYNQDTAVEISSAIQNAYTKCFNDLLAKFTLLKTKELSE